MREALGRLSTQTASWRFRVCGRAHAHRRYQDIELDMNQESKCAAQGGVAGGDLYPSVSAT